MSKNDTPTTEYRWSLNLESREIGSAIDPDPDRALLQLLEEVVEEDQYGEIYDVLNVIHEQFIGTVQQLTEYDHSEEISELSRVPVSRVQKLGEMEFYDGPVDSDSSLPQEPWEMAVGPGEYIKLTVEVLTESGYTPEMQHPRFEGV